LYLFAVRIFYFVHYFVMNFKNNVLFKLQFSVFNLVFYSTVAVLAIHSPSSLNTRPAEFFSIGNIAARDLTLTCAQKFSNSIGCSFH
jgi:hypothetical protein